MVQNEMKLFLFDQRSESEPRWWFHLILDTELSKVIFPLFFIAIAFNFWGDFIRNRPFQSKKFSSAILKMLKWYILASQKFLLLPVLFSPLSDTDWSCEDVQFSRAPRFIVFSSHWILFPALPKHLGDTRVERAPGPCHPCKKWCNFQVCACFAEN